MDAKRNGVQLSLSVWSVAFDLQFQMRKSEFMPMTFLPENGCKA
jgi:hypothetical protein